MSNLHRYADRLFAFVEERDWARFENPAKECRAVGTLMSGMCELLLNSS